MKMPHPMTKQFWGQEVPLREQGHIKYSAKQTETGNGNGLHLTRRQKLTRKKVPNEKRDIREKTRQNGTAMQKNLVKQEACHVRVQITTKDVKRGKCRKGMTAWRVIEGRIEERGGVY